MVQVSTHVLSPKAMSIADYLLHKAPYWSSSQYDHRVSENSRNTFLKFVEDQHKDSRQNEDFEGDSALLKCDKATCHDEHYVRLPCAGCWLNLVSASAGNSAEKEGPGSSTPSKEGSSTKSLLSKVFSKAKVVDADKDLSSNGASGKRDSVASPAKGAGAEQRDTAASPAKAAGSGLRANAVTPEKSPSGGKRAQAAPSRSPGQHARNESVGG